MIWTLATLCFDCLWLKFKLQTNLDGVSILLSLPPTFQGAVISRDLSTHVKRLPGNMCVFVFPLHLSLLGSEFKSGWYCSVSAVDLSDCCVRSPRFRIFNFSYIFFHPASSKLAWLLFFLSTTQESPTRKDNGRAWTPPLELLLFCSLSELKLRNCF